ncbi:hypothetical protein [Nostoc sp. CMAA1605]|uniref:hypothetical protein n=1 Tax=Nostoc sp. CMAA1605 TaxID=2055159 RepID=UPI001F235CC5|nr:hypothetical protein [Nostoc sp. CMAA1605]MCF4965924.1 hypothetical protein [Nostoc sp. CMAA1605]
MNRRALNLPGFIDPLESQQWYKDDTYYQILLVTPRTLKQEGSHLETTIITQERKEFKQYLIDTKTYENLQEYRPNNDYDKYNHIGAYLPSPGVVFPPGFLKALFPDKSEFNESEIPEPRVVLNNFYDPIRTLLHSRKISQLVAKTWYTYLTVKKAAEQNHSFDPWNLFINGKWSDLLHKEWHQSDDAAEILDGLIAREIFFSVRKSSPNNLYPEDLNIYYPLHSQEYPPSNHKVEDYRARLIILPSSLAWQAISLSLLLAGQAFYPTDQQGNILTYAEYQKAISHNHEEIRYHQISQPILSTIEIVLKYGLAVSFDMFEGVIKEMDLNPGKSSIAYQAVLPYPPIPWEIHSSFDNLKKWAKADDQYGDLPFYHRIMSQDSAEVEYLVDVEYFASPYPYIPLSCT